MMVIAELWEKLNLLHSTQMGETILLLSKVLFRFYKEFIYPHGNIFMRKR